MIDGLKPYPAYKDSGVPWLGKVPEHWTVRRLKSSVRNVIEPTAARRSGDLYLALENVESWTGRIRRADSNMPFDSQVKRFRPGDILFGKLRPYLAKVTRPATSGVCVGEFLVLRPNELEASAPYIEQVLRSKPVIDAVSSSTFGAKMPRADWHFIGSMAIALPPLPEQTAIVRFLDHTDRRIRRYIRAKQKQIKLLEELKAAIIHRAVTRGLDPNVRLKPSGVEWLGDVPEHWEVRRLRSLVERIDQGVSPQAENYLADDRSWGVLKAGCVNRGLFREEEHKRLPASFSIDPNLAIEEGDVLISRASGSPNLVGSVGRVKSLRYRLILSDKTFRLVFRQCVDPDFMVLAMNSRYYREQVEQAISGAEGLANNLPLSSLRGFRFAIPVELSEQRGIAARVCEATSTLQGAVIRAEREISLLREYRTRLIADVVTGKLDVREAAARLPDEAEDPEPLDEAAAEDEAEPGDTDEVPEETEA
jgi:type I restriction enzyme S subunit